jgi:hypothetical protein
MIVDDAVLGFVGLRVRDARHDQRPRDIVLGKNTVPASRPTKTVIIFNRYFVISRSPFVCFRKLASSHRTSYFDLRTGQALDVNPVCRLGRDVASSGAISAKAYRPVHFPLWFSFGYFLTGPSFSKRVGLPCVFNLVDCFDSVPFISRCSET